MRFTFWAIGAPFLLVALAKLLYTPGDRGTLLAMIAGFSSIWFFVGIPCVLVYWIMRVARRAWRDGSAPAASEPESGRIFGRLS